jgi:3-hydroxyisobutyrate dehydrogenase
MACNNFVFVGDTEIGSRISQSLIEGGFSSAPGLRDADVVFTYYETQQGLEDLYFDSQGLLQETRADALLVDLSPTTPAFARELYAVARVNDRYTLDAPLVVRNIVEEDAFAEKDNLLMFVGGEEESFDQVRAMLHAIARHVLYLGEVGCGQSAKIMATLQRASALIGVIESYATYVNGDVVFDWEEVIDTLSIAGCVSPVNIAYIDAIRNKDFTGTYTVEILMAELVAALSMADDKDHIIPQAEAGFRLMELLAMVGGASYNPAALALIFDDEDAARKFGLDWSRAAGAYDDHDHDCACGHDHAHGASDDEFDLYEAADGFPGAFGGLSSN